MAKYPIYLYHPDREDPATAKTEQEEKDLRRKGYDTKYQHKEFPKVLYHESHTPTHPHTAVVSDPAALDALGDGWLPRPPEIPVARVALGTPSEAVSELAAENAALKAQ